MARASRGRPVDQRVAKSLLDELFELAEADYRDRAPTDIPAHAIQATDRLFLSATQAYRDSLPSCVLARIVDPLIDIRLPATAYGENAFSGRSLSENVVTPFLRSKSIPTSATPFLSAVRGGARFMVGGEPRIQRDKAGFTALAEVIDYVRGLDADSAKNYLRFLLRCFISLREARAIPLKQIARPNLEQLARLIDELLAIRSRGAIPHSLAIALFQTINDCHRLQWEVEFQGINVSDRASGAVGDITIRHGGAVILGVEVTERPINGGRVRFVFDEKVSPFNLNDYLFVSTTSPDDTARKTARSYTAVGHEMNFVDLKHWLINNLATIGPECRATFQTRLISLLSGPTTPAEIKVAWNSAMDRAIGVDEPTRVSDD